MQRKILSNSNARQGLRGFSQEWIDTHKKRIYYIKASVPDKTSLVSNYYINDHFKWEKICN